VIRSTTPEVSAGLGKFCAKAFVLLPLRRFESCGSTLTLIHPVKISFAQSHDIFDTLARFDHLCIAATGFISSQVLTLQGCWSRTSGRGLPILAGGCGSTLTLIHPVKISFAQRRRDRPGTSQDASRGFLHSGCRSANR
jgi:hypothetical protein